MRRPPHRCLNPLSEQHGYLPDILPFADQSCKSMISLVRIVPRVFYPFSPLCRIRHQRSLPLLESYIEHALLPLLRRFRPLLVVSGRKEQEVEARAIRPKASDLRRTLFSPRLLLSRDLLSHLSSSLLAANRTLVLPRNVLLRDVVSLGITGVRPRQAKWNQSWHQSHCTMGRTPSSIPLHMQYTPVVSVECEESVAFLRFRLFFSPPEGFIDEALTRSSSSQYKKSSSLCTIPRLIRGRVLFAATRLGRLATVPSSQICGSAFASEPISSPG